MASRPPRVIDSVVLAVTLSLFVPGLVRAATADEVAALRDRVYPSLVNISVVNQRFSEGKTQRYPGAGSGVILTAEGHVITNFHVAGDTSRVECTLIDGRVFRAEIVANDPLTDLSVLRLVGGNGEEFPAAELGSSAGLEVGQTVFAMGNPLALSSSMTQGIISNPARVFTDFTGTEMREVTLGEGNLSGLLTRWIQHDALILPGNSGGPLVDLEGRVIGINELGGRGMGFAIPADIVRDVLGQALGSGSIERGWFGFSILPVEKLGRRQGALVSAVLSGSPAARAGLRAGDILLRLGGEQVVVRFFEQVPLLYERVAGLEVGSSVELEVERDGARVPLTVRVGPMESFKGEEGEIAALGVTVQEITEPMRLVKNLGPATGLLLTGLRPGSSLDRARPRPAVDDLLVSVEGAAVSTITGLVEIVASLDGADTVLMELRRGDERILTVAPAPRPEPALFGGELPRAWIGLATQVITPQLAIHLELPGQTGYRVTQVYPWTEAERAGFEAGDLLIALDGEPLEASRLQDGEDLRRRIEQLYISDEVVFSVHRDGTALSLPVTLEPRPEEAEEVAAANWEMLDFSVRQITFRDRVVNRWEREQTGVIVVEADRGGWAQMAGLRLGDLVLEIEDRAVAEVASFEAARDAVVAAQPIVVKLFVRRGFRTHFILIEPEWESLPTATEERR